MAERHFVYNLSPDTFRSMRDGFFTPFGYLLAPNNATRKLRSYLPEILKKEREFFVDNGNFKHIGLIEKRFKERAKALKAKVKNIEEQTLKRTVRRGELPQSLTQKYQALAREIRKACREAVKSKHNMVGNQLQLSPSALIGVEDLTMASWLSLDIERTYTRFERRTYRKMNQRVAKQAVEVLGSLPHPLRFHYYPVASAVSFNTAYDAGQEFARRGIRAVSMGFGAYMADNNYVDHMYVGRRRLDFGANLPARYMRTVLAAKGFWVGYESVAGRPPRRFHFLGLGAPIMLPLISLVARKSVKITFDAVSPIKDSTKDGMLYVDKPAPLKIKIRKAAHRLARTVGGRWGCPCPFCADFVAKHPFKYRLGRQWFLRTGNDKVLAKDLKPGGDLYRAYPLFSEPVGGTKLRRNVNFARVGHNHWIIDRLISGVQRASKDRRLESYVTRIVRRYEKNTSPPFARALKLSLELAVKDGE